MNTIYRTRFAPSPSGIMHIGNLRSALMSFLCAKESNGKFILRIEDTDQKRTEEKFLLLIYDFLNLMNLTPDEGPLQSGPYGPYIQSKRTKIYEKYLKLFLEKKLIYRCFQTEEELENRKKKQLELKLPPRYLKNNITQEEEKLFLEKKIPFVWRLTLPKTIITIFDKVKKHISFDLANFADIPLTRQDGSFTFLFANFIDDITMNINYVIRGEEHLSNSAIQAYMYKAINEPLPIYYHLPLICDENGKKLSKRDFGFNIQDLINEGFLPEAILNYLIIIGTSFKEEIFSLDEAIKNKLFSENQSAGMITYDIKKLLWVNQKWMKKINDEILITYLKKYTSDKIVNKKLILKIKNEARTLKELSEIIVSLESIKNNIIIEKIYKICFESLLEVIKKEENEYIKWEKIKIILEEFGKNNNISVITMYKTFRYILIEKKEGISLSILCESISKNNILLKIKSINYQ